MARAVFGTCRLVLACIERALGVGVRLLHGAARMCEQGQEGESRAGYVCATCSDLWCVSAPECATSRMDGEGSTLSKQAHALFIHRFALCAHLSGAHSRFDAVRRALCGTCVRRRGTCSRASEICSFTTNAYLSVEGG